ncbi:MAG: hypothetical protein ACXVCP_04590 [Bdellovibrio sp.]
MRSFPVFLILIFFAQIKVYAISRCEKEIDILLKSWNVIEDEVVMEDPALKKKWPTKVMGEWVTLQLKSEKIFLQKRMKRQNITVEFTDGCQQHVILSENAQVDVKESYTDTDLTNDIAEAKQQGKKLLIYLWSAHMNLSREELRQINDLQLKKTRLRILLDSNADKSIAITFLKKFKLASEFQKKNASVELLERNSSLHFPCHFVVDMNGKWLWVPGYVKPEDFKKVLSVE